MEMTSFTEGMMPGPDGSILRFFYDTEKNEAATIAEGRAIYDTVLMVEVITPGQKASTPRFELERVWSPQSKAALNTTAESKRFRKYAEFAEASADAWGRVLAFIARHGTGGLRLAA